MQPDDFSRQVATPDRLFGGRKGLKFDFSDFRSARARGISLSAIALLTSLAMQPETQLVNFRQQGLRRRPHSLHLDRLPE
jgi:hypothetical protein